MIETITTKEEARKYRYNRWAGNPNGTAYIETRCAYSVWDRGRGCMSHQCAKKNGHGPEGLYCEAHSRLVPSTESKTWYAVSLFRFRIEPVEIVKATEKFVWLKYLKGSRQTSRVSQFERYFENLESAKQWVIATNEGIITNRLAEIEAAKNIIEKTKSL